MKYLVKTLAALVTLAIGGIVTGLFWYIASLQLLVLAAWTCMCAMICWNQFVTVTTCVFALAPCVADPLAAFIILIVTIPSGVSIGMLCMIGWLGPPVYTIMCAVTVFKEAGGICSE
ncbi:MAG: hypothetical protein WC030_02385 [Candidatus Paceibacterota bacterium]